MKNKFRRITIIAFIAIIGFTMTACDNETTKVEVVGSSSIAAPEVTATAVAGGVKLTWPHVTDANSYFVYRSGGSQTVPFFVNAISYGTIVNEDGLLQVFDYVSDSNKLTTDTLYTYTVTATARSYTMNSSTGEAKVTTGTIPEKGTNFTAPDSVTLELFPERETYTITITAPTTGVIPSSYNIQIYRNGVRHNSHNVSAAPYSVTTSNASWSYSYQATGDEWEAVVYAVGNSYFTSSDKVSSDTQIVNLTTGTMPEKGTKFSAPDSVTLELFPERETYTITIMHPTTGVIPSSYNIQINRNGVRYSSHNGISAAYGDNTIYSYQYWYSSSQTTGDEYVAVVYAVGNSYFASSDTVTSASQIVELPQPVELFGNNSTPYVKQQDLIIGTDDETSTFKGIRYSINMSNMRFIDGVTYTIERAPAIRSNNSYITGNYTEITPKKYNGSGYENIASGDLITLAVMPIPCLFDEIYSAASDYYYYRIKAVKGGDMQYRTSNVLFFNPLGYISGYLTVAAGFINDINTNFEITPVINYKDILQANDKLVLCYSIAPSYYGIYQDSISFSKTELEAGTAKNMVVRNRKQDGSDDSNKLYVQAYIATADSFQNYPWFTFTGYGLSSYGSYTDNTTGSGRTAYYFVFDW